MIVVRLPHEKMAAKKPAISMSCFLEKECGMHIGSAAIKEGWLYAFTLLFKNAVKLSIGMLQN